ncbi:MAG: QueT transporter family protein, partial [Symbiobacteriaceae bacterium]
MARRLARSAVIAALYVVLTYLLQPISFGQVQFRVSEALAVLPMLWPEAIPALFVGVALIHEYMPLYLGHGRTRRQFAA